MNINPTGQASGTTISQTPPSGTPSPSAAPLNAKTNGATTAQPQQTPAANEQASAAKPTGEAKESQAASTTAKAAAQQAKPVANQTQTAASQVDITTKDTVSHKLAELAKALETRTALISSMPEDIQKALKDIIRQGSLAESKLPEGLASLLKSQTITNNQISMLASILDDAGRLAGDNRALNTLAQLLGKLFANSDASSQKNSLPGTSVQPAAEQALASNIREALTGQARQPLQPNVQLPPELAKLAETVKQPDLAQLWRVLQPNSQENKPYLQQAQQKLLELARQMIKDPASANTAQQSVRQALSQFPEAAKLLEQNQLLSSVPRPAANPASLSASAAQTSQTAQAAQMFPEAKTPEFPQQQTQAGSQQPAGASQALTLTEGGKNFNMAASLRLEQNLSQLANNLLNGNISLEEAKTALGNLLKSFKGFDMSKLSQLDISQDKQAAALLRQTMNYIPPQIQQAAARYNLPELERGWTLLQIAKLEKYLERLPNELKQAAANLREMAATMQRASGSPVAERQGESSVLSFNTTVYFEGGQAYPAHVHVYQEYSSEGSGANRRKKPETWMRITLDTENIGPVDTFFRLYEQEKLDIRVRFQDAETAAEFGEYLPEIRRAMHNSPLDLTDLSVRSTITGQ